MIGLSFVSQCSLGIFLSDNRSKVKWQMLPDAGQDAVTDCGKFLNQAEETEKVLFFVGINTFKSISSVVNLQGAIVVIYDSFQELAKYSNIKIIDGKLNGEGVYEISQLIPEELKLHLTKAHYFEPLKEVVRNVTEEKEEPVAQEGTNNPISEEREKVLNDQTQTQQTQEGGVSMPGPNLKAFEPANDGKLAQILKKCVEGATTDKLVVAFINEIGGHFIEGDDSALKKAFASLKSEGVKKQFFDAYVDYCSTPRAEKVWNSYALIAKHGITATDSVEITSADLDDVKQLLEIKPIDSLEPNLMKALKENLNPKLETALIKKQPDKVTGVFKPTNEGKLSSILVEALAGVEEKNIKPACNALTMFFFGEIDKTPKELKLKKFTAYCDGPGVKLYHAWALMLEHSIDVKKASEITGATEDDINQLLSLRPLSDAPDTFLKEYEQVPKYEKEFTSKVKAESEVEPEEEPKTETEKTDGAAESKLQKIVKAIEKDLTNGDKKKVHKTIFSYCIGLIDESSMKKVLKEKKADPKDLIKFGNSDSCNNLFFAYADIAFNGSTKEEAVSTYKTEMWGLNELSSELPPDKKQIQDITGAEWPEGLEKKGDSGKVKTAKKEEKEEAEEPSEAVEAVAEEVPADEGDFEEDNEEI